MKKLLLATVLLLTAAAWSYDFKQLPSGLSIANFGNGVVVSESREAMNAEVESMCMTSKKVLDSAASHGAEIIVTACPLCRYNLEKNGESEMPVIYFTELLAEALGVKEG